MASSDIVEFDNEHMPKEMPISLPTNGQQHHKDSNDIIVSEHSNILGKILIINIEKGTYV